MPALKREAALLGALLLGVLGWELSGGDLTVAAGFGSAQGFAARDSFWAWRIGHEGLRWLEVGAWLLLAADGLRPGRQAQRRALGVGLVVLLLVPTLKSFSHTSCPWDLQPFGGLAPWVSHWNWRLRDGGPGHCFPSGHTAGVAAFAVWAWLYRRVWMWVALAALLAFASLSQWARGAHFVSHSLWAAWLGLALSWLLLRVWEAAAAKKNPLRLSAERVGPARVGLSRRCGRSA